MLFPSIIYYYYCYSVKCVVCPYYYYCISLSTSRLVLLTVFKLKRKKSFLL